MRTVKELQQRLRPENSFETRYDISDDNKIHLLYVSPKHNATGYYRMIAPALEINKTNTYKAIITSIEPNNFADKLNDTVGQLDERLIAWADYVIFPTLFSDLRYLVQAIRTIQPRVQLIMDLDRLPKERNTQLIANLNEMDMITVATLKLQKDLKKQLAEIDIHIAYLPTLVSRFAYEEMPPLKRNTSEKLRVGFIKPDAEDLLSLKEILLEMNSSLKEKIQFVCFGKPYSSEEADEFIKETDTEIHKTVSFLDYFEKLNDLELDVLLLPSNDGPKDEFQNNYLFKELAVFGIPVVASEAYLMSKFIEDGETGWIAQNPSDWVAVLEELVLNKDAIEIIGRNALKWCWATQGYNRKNLEAFLDVFI